MGKVVIDISMSLDGCIVGPNDTPDEGLGDAGDRLHDWYLDPTEADRTLIKDGESALGALVFGRRTYDNSQKYWGGGGPHGDMPCVVVSHGVPEGLGEGTPFTFVDNIEGACDVAKRIAGDKDVRVMGGANVPQQFLRAGLVDELVLHVVPVLLGPGRKLLDNLGPDIDLKPIEVIDSPNVTHLRYRVGH
jgi:dihydrofolate reductase